MITLCRTKGLPELQIRNTFKRHYLMNHWSKFKIISQNRPSWHILPKLHKLFWSTVHRGCQSSREEMSLNDIWTTSPISIYLHMNVPHNALFQNCINGSAPRNRRTVRAPDKKSLNDISSRSTDPNSIYFHGIVPHDALSQNFTNGSTQLNSHYQVSDPGPKSPLVF